MSSEDVVVASLEKGAEIGREIAVNLYKNGDVSLWSASEIDRNVICLPHIIEYIYKNFSIRNIRSNEL